VADGLHLLGAESLAGRRGRGGGGRRRWRGPLPAGPTPPWYWGPGEAWPGDGLDPAALALALVLADRLGRADDDDDEGEEDEP
jgi:hypothetical protein